MSTDSEPKWRRLEPDERREQIFACAARLFGERPYAEVSTSDIAADAGVARGLINHYFGTKRELYLAVVRRAVTVPHLAFEGPSEGSLETRVGAAVDWFLNMVAKQEKMWLTATAPEGIGRDHEVEQILEEADRKGADRVLEVFGASHECAHADELNAVVRTYAGMVKAAGREWLQRGALSRQQVHTVLSTTLVALIADVFPAIQREPSG